MGGRLYERSGKGMTCTLLGEAACRHFRLLLSELRKAEGDLAAVARGEHGSLVIGCFSLFSGWPLTDAARMFRERHPHVALAIGSGSAEKLLKELDNGAIDLYIGRAHPTMSPEIYKTAVLANDEIVLTCARHHPLAAKKVALTDCLHYPWITATPGGRIVHDLEGKFRQAGLTPPTAIGTVSLEFGQGVISDGVHLWMLPGSVAHVKQTRGELHILSVDLDLQRMPMAAIWRRERHSTRHILDFVATLQSAVAAADVSGLND